MHRLLERQLRRHFPVGSSPVSEEFRAFTQAVLEAYQQADDDRKMTERSLELMSSELLERNEQLQRDLAAIKRLELELRQADKLSAVGRLSAGIAHEINTPVQFVGDSVSFLRDACADFIKVIEQSRTSGRAVLRGEDPAPALRQLEQISDEVDIDELMREVPKALERATDGLSRVAQIVMAMKEFGRPDQREGVLVDINRGLANSLTVARSEIRYCAEVELDLGDLPLITGYPGELNQVFLNLLVNAAHAIAERHGDDSRTGLIRIKTARDGDAIVVTISDNGGGIAAENRKHIFEPFFSTKAVGKGTGQGLAISRSIIVDKHGGAITFETEVGRGTTFFIRVPIEQAKLAPPPDMTTPLNKGFRGEVGSSR